MSCPRCHKRSNCSTLKILDSAETELEASNIIRSLKTPDDIKQRLAILKTQLTSQSSSPHDLLGRLLTELIATFPNAIPQTLLIEKATNLGLSPEYVEKIIAQLNQEGLVIINRDQTLHQTHELLKFPSVPFKFGKLNVKRPVSLKHLHKTLQKQQRSS
jgi:hypothetical protein